MASLSRLESLLSNVEPKLRRSLVSALTLIASTLKYGDPTQHTKARNFGQVFLTATTPSTPDLEFVIPHGLDVTPYLAIPILPLGESGAKVVNLTVTRPADGRFVYLSSPEADTPIWLLVEGA